MTKIQTVWEAWLASVPNRIEQQSDGTYRISLLHCATYLPWGGVKSKNGQLDGRALIGVGPTEDEAKRQLLYKIRDRLVFYEPAWPGDMIRFQGPTSAQLRGI